MLLHSEKSIIQSKTLVLACKAIAEAVIPRLGETAVNSRRSKGAWCAPSRVRWIQQSMHRLTPLLPPAATQAIRQARAE
eukprot:1162006-Pelagomonas_calceolata.AAC.5